MITYMLKNLHICSKNSHWHYENLVSILQHQNIYREKILLKEKNV